MARAANSRKRGLFCEPLESRAMLAGNVTVALAGNVLTFTGDVSGNQVEMTVGPNAGDLVIKGIDTNIIGITAINTLNTPITSINVNLDGGSDKWSFDGTTAVPVNGKTTVAGNLAITETGGTNVYSVKNVIVNANFTLAKGTADSENVLTLDGVTVVGNTALTSAAGINGDSTTTVTGGSSLQGNLTVAHNAGEDNLFVFQSTIGGNATITNGNGNTRTVFGQVDGAPVIGGNLAIVNGTGYDKVLISRTDVFGAVAIVNGDGTTLVSTETSKIGLGSFGATGDFTVLNGLGFDTFTMNDVIVRGTLTVVHGAAADPFGSTADIQKTTIGIAMVYAGDGGGDSLKIHNNTSIALVNLMDLRGGSDNLEFSNKVFIGGFLLFTTGAGDDTVYFQETTVQVGTIIDLNTGNDTLTLEKGTKFFGGATLLGDGGTMDTIKRRILPALDAILISPSNITGFEIEIFLTQ